MLYGIAISECVMQTEQTELVSITVRFPKGVIDQVKERCSMKGEYSDFIRNAVREKLEREKKKEVRRT